MLKEQNRIKENYGGLSLEGHSYSRPFITFYRFDDDIRGSKIAERRHEVSGTESIEAQIEASEVKNSKGYLGLFDDSRTNLVGSLVSVNTTKTLKAPTGQFSLDLMPTITHGRFAGLSWEDVLQDGDWVRIQTTTSTIPDPAQLVTVMVGKIDSISCSLSVSGTGVNAKITVAGRDYAAPAMDMQIEFNQYDVQASAALKAKMTKLFGATSPTSLSGSPSTVLPAIFKTLASNEVGFSLPPRLPVGLYDNSFELPWIDVLDTKSSVKGVRGTMFAMSILKSPGGSSVWKLCSTYQNPCMNEMFIDIDDNGFYHLIFRERPHVNLEQTTDSPWFSLKTSEIPLVEISSLNLTKGRDRVNYIYITGNMGVMTKMQFAYSRPFINSKDMKRYGLKKLEYRTTYFNTESFRKSKGSATSSAKEAEADATRKVDTATGNDKVKLFSEVEEWINLLVNWNCLNPYYFTGVLSLATLRPDIRIGTKVVLTGGPSPVYPIITAGEVNSLSSAKAIDCGTCTTGYVEGVTHSWSLGSGVAKTTLQLTRVYPENKRVSDIRQSSYDWNEILTGVSSESSALSV